MCLHTLDTEFQQFYINVVDSLVDEGEIDTEEAIMDDHESRVTHIFVSFKRLSSPAAPTIKTESKELHIL